MRLRVVVPLRNLALGIVLLLVTPAAEAITLQQVSPSVGPTTGGTVVTIRGSGFLETCSLAAPPCGLTVMQVSFGDTPATSFTVISDSEIQAVTPAHIAGTVDVRVDHIFGFPVLPGAFTFGATPVPALSLAWFMVLAATLLAAGLLSHPGA